MIYLVILNLWHQHYIFTCFFLFFFHNVDFNHFRATPVVNCIICYAQTSESLIFIIIIFQLKFKKRGFIRWQGTGSWSPSMPPSKPPFLNILWIYFIKCHHQNPFRLSSRAYAWILWSNYNNFMYILITKIIKIANLNEIACLVWWLSLPTIQLVNFYLTANKIQTWRV
jgi:hypothetical protein